MCFRWKAKKSEKKARAKRNQYSASAMSRRIKPLREYAEEQTSLGKTETTIKLVYPLLAVFGWDSENVESQYRVGDTRQRADIALIKDGRAVAIFDVVKFEEDLNNKAAIETLSSDAVACGVHLAVLTNGSTYWFYSVDTDAKEMSKESVFFYAGVE